MATGVNDALPRTAGQLVLSQHEMVLGPNFQSPIQPANAGIPLCNIAD